MSAPRLAYARSRANRVLTDTCVINSGTQTQGDMTGYTTALAAARRMEFV